MPTLVRTIVKSSLIVGSISFACGFFGPILLSSSNLGPLLGILVSGPVGLLVGALWGTVRWSTHGGAKAGAVAWWILGIWILTLLYTLFMTRLAPRAAVPAAGVQLLILLASIFLQRRRRAPSP